MDLFNSAKFECCFLSYYSFYNYLPFEEVSTLIFLQISGEHWQDSFQHVKK